MADGFVLAKHASQRAAAEKHRAAAPRAADAGLLPQMGRRAGHHGQGAHAAKAIAAGFGAFRAAPAGTEVAQGHLGPLLSMQNAEGSVAQPPGGCKGRDKFFTTYGKMLVFPKTLWYTAYCLLLRAVAGGIWTREERRVFRKEWVSLSFSFMRRIPAGCGGAGGRVPSGLALQLQKRRGRRAWAIASALFDCFFATGF